MKQYVIKYDDGAYNLNQGFTATLEEATRYATREEAEEMAKNFFGVASIEPLDEEQVANVAAVRGIQECIGIVDMMRPRNGHNSAENKLCDKLTEVIESYFGVKRVNVNDLIASRSRFREYFIDG